MYTRLEKLNSANIGKADFPLFAENPLDDRDLADINGGGSAASRGPRALGAKSIQKCFNPVVVGQNVRRNGPGR